LLAALAHYLVADALAFSKRGHPGPLYRADVNEHIARTIARRDEAKTLLGIEKFDSSYGHNGLLIAFTTPVARISDDGETAEFWEMT
jgi:hypothetical protein